MRALPATRNFDARSWMGLRTRLMVSRRMSHRSGGFSDKRPAKDLAYESNTVGRFGRSPTLTRPNRLVASPRLPQLFIHRRLLSRCYAIKPSLRVRPRA